MAQITQPNSFQSRQRRNTRKNAFWAGAWILATALFSFGPKFLWPGQFGLTVAAAVINLGVGIGMVLTMRDALKNTDDLHRKVILDAMAIALGVGTVVGTTYPIMESYELVPDVKDMPALILLMGGTYLVSMILGLRRYR